MSRRTYPVPNKNISGSDYIEIKRAKQIFSGTSNLAKTIIQQNGNFPLLTPSGKLKPYQGTYGLSGRTEDGNKTYCLNTSHSYRDLLSITKGKYLLTPPNVSNDNFIQLSDVSDAQKLYNGLYYVYTYSNNNLLEYMSPGYPLSGPYPSTTSSYVPNQIEYSIASDANQRIIVDPTYTITYSSQSCVLHPNVGNDITINNDYQSKFSFNRTINLDLLTGFQFPIKFNMAYEEGDCIDVNNDIQGDYSFPASPTNISPPVITGVVVSGVLKLSVNVGTWTGYPYPTFSYQWYRNSTLILLATIHVYSVNPGTDLNKNITCKVTGSNSSGSETATSNIIVPAIPANTTAPSITPSTPPVLVTTTLTCNPGSWSGYPAPDPITGYAYQWYRGASQISGATNSTYTTQSTADIGQSITCKVIASNLFGSSSQVTTSNSVNIQSAPVNTSAPVITGSSPYLVGSTLSCNPGSWSASPIINPSTGYAYQWLRGSTPIGTNSNSYTIVSGDIGQDITCQVTASNQNGSSSPEPSNIIIPSGPPVNTAAPDISGNLVVGNTLTTTNGTWSGSPTSFTYTYQWKNNGVSISGATGNTYTTQAADIGQLITCEVTADNGITPNGVAPSNALTPTSVPTISVAPSITPTTIVAGSGSLSCSTGTWTASPTTPPLTYNYQWFRGASAISGETNSTYATQSPTDQGQSITCEVTAVNGVISSSPAPSNAVTPT